MDQIIGQLSLPVLGLGILAALFALAVMAFRSPPKPPSGGEGRGYRAREDS